MANTSTHQAKKTSNSKQSGVIQGQKKKLSSNLSQDDPVEGSRNVERDAENMERASGGSGRAKSKKQQ